MRMIKRNAINWFEIPATDLSRAQNFYETILELKLTSLDLANIQMRLIPTEDQTGVGGAICYSKEFYQPSATDGPLLYLNADPDVQKVLDKVAQAGGKVLLGKTQITEEFGYMAIILDTEGNRIGLHSMN
jgi:predicted enzyme related to lactoylglutathione lyase